MQPSWAAPHRCTGLRSLTSKRDDVSTALTLELNRVCWCEFSAEVREALSQKTPLLNQHWPPDQPKCLCEETNEEAMTREESWEGLLDLSYRLAMKTACVCRLKLNHVWTVLSQAALWVQARKITLPLSRSECDVQVEHRSLVKFAALWCIKKTGAHRLLCERGVFFLVFLFVFFFFLALCLIIFLGVRILRFKILKSQILSSQGNKTL